MLRVLSLCTGSIHRCFEASFATSDLGEVQRLASIDEVVKIFNTSARLEAVNTELVPPENLSIGFRNPSKQIIKMVFKSPAILSIKLMTPPIPSIQKRVSRIRTMYALFHSSAHIYNYLAIVAGVTMVMGNSTNVSQTINRLLLCV